MTVQQAFDFTQPNPPQAESRRNLVIEAGAGTGKTTAIVAEVLKLMLENEELNPERIAPVHGRVVPYRNLLMAFDLGAAPRGTR